MCLPKNTNKRVETYGRVSLLKKGMYEN